MVQTDISQTAAECAEWRQALRTYRDEFSHDKKELEQLCRSSLSKDQLQQVEHLHNQFHIQLINIHDLKQSIKVHDRKMNFEKAVFNGNVNEDSLLRHESLLQEYAELKQMLEEVREEFQQFLKRTA